jgi:hypothetical protein
MSTMARAAVLSQPLLQIVICEPHQPLTEVVMKQVRTVPSDTLDGFLVDGIINV